MDTGTVVLDISMSLDGFIALPDDSPGPIHDWFFSGETPNRYNAAFSTSEASSPLLDEMFETTGALVVGRRTYDVTGGWGGNHPFLGVPVFVVTHRPPSAPPEGATRFTFATDGVKDAVEQARAAAAEKNVVVMGGASVAQQCLAAGLLDALQIHLTPVVLGEGVPLFPPGGADRVELEHTRIVDAEDAAHLRYRIKR
jgi:dihydrofolate reductase